MISLAAIGLLVATVETGSFSRAARRLGVTPSAVSRRVMRLEQELGVALLARTTRSLRLTDDGQAFYALLRQQYPALCPRVIFFTGAASEATNRAFLAQCGQPWLRKPFTLTVLRRVLAQMLGDVPPASVAPGP